MSIIGILKIMEVQEDDMEVQEEAVFQPMFIWVLVFNEECFFLHLH